MHKLQQNSSFAATGGQVCKTFIRRFDPAPRLQQNPPLNPIKTGLLRFVDPRTPVALGVPSWVPNVVIWGANGRSNRDQNGITTGIKNTTTPEVSL